MTRALCYNFVRIAALQLFALALVASFAFAATVPKAHAAQLTEPQISAILGLLSSFGVDQATITNVSNILHGNTGSPPATFTATPASGTAPLTVTFFGSSVQTPFTIDYGDPSGAGPQVGCSGGCFGAHTYTQPGTYTATLHDGNGATRTVTVTVTLERSAPAFTATPSSGAAPLSVTFSISDIGVSYTIAFGDGTTGVPDKTSTAAVATHSYSQAGTYTALLKNSAGTTVATKTVTVTTTQSLAPTNLRGNCIGSGQVTLSWDPAPDAAYYFLRLNDPSNDSAQCRDGWYCSGTTDVRSDTGLYSTSYTGPVSPDKSYQWWILGVSRSGAVSQSVTGGIAACGANNGKPAAPSGTITADQTTIKVGQSTMIRSSVTPSGHDAITKTTINIGTASVIPYGTDKQRSYLFTPTQTGDVIFTAYAQSNEFPVWTAYGTVTVHVESGSAVTPPPPAPGTPTGLRGACVGGGQMQLSWDAAPNAAYYLLRVNDPTNDNASCQDNWFCANTTDVRTDVGLAATSYRTSVIPDRAYQWWLIAVNSAGDYSQTIGGPTPSCPSSNGYPSVSLGSPVDYVAAAGSAFQVFEIAFSPDTLSASAATVFLSYWDTLIDALSDVFVSMGV